MITKDGWKLEGVFRWVPTNPDVKGTCNSCLGRGKSEYDWDHTECQKCGGNGYFYTRKERGPEPELSKHLVQWMRDAYQEWEELYGIRDKLDEEIISFWPKHLAIAHFQEIVDVHTAREVLAWEKVSMFRATEAAWHRRIVDKYTQIIEALVNENL